MTRIRYISFLALMNVLCGTTTAESVRLELSISSPLRYSNTPLDPTIDFSEFVRMAGVDGELDPNSIKVRNTATNQTIPHSLTEDFAYGDKGRV